MNEAQAKKLREPFPPELVGKIPKGGTQLDYVGHAAVTDRLLQVDPDWTWKPLARDETGTPVIAPNAGDKQGEPLGLWIELTVCGVTRPGFGGGKTAKECISDALRNAAMRFGVGLDLWSKEDLQAGDVPADNGDPKPSTLASEITNEILSERLLAAAAKLELTDKTSEAIAKAKAEKSAPEFAAWLNTQVERAEAAATALATAGASA